MQHINAYYPIGTDQDSSILAVRRGIILVIFGEILLLIILRVITIMQSCCKKKYQQNEKHFANQHHSAEHADMWVGIERNEFMENENKHVDDANIQMRKDQKGRREKERMLAKREIIIKIDEGAEFEESAYNIRQKDFVDLYQTEAQQIKPLHSRSKSSNSSNEYEETPKENAKQGPPDEISSPRNSEVGVGYPFEQFYVSILNLKLTSVEVFEIWAIFVGHSFIAFGAVFIFFPFGISLFLVFGHFGLTVAITLILVLTKNTNFLVKMLSGIILVGNIGMFKLAIFGIVRSNGGYFSEFYL